LAFVCLFVYLLVTVSNAIPSGFDNDRKADARDLSGGERLVARGWIRRRAALVAPPTSHREFPARSAPQQLPDVRPICDFLLDAASSNNNSNKQNETKKQK